MERKKSKELNIGLMGFEFYSPNKGCEALSYSFIHFLEEYRKKNNIKISVFTWDTELGAMPKCFPNIQFNRIFPAKVKDPKLRWVRAVRKCDVIFDVTMGDSFSDIYSKEYCSWLIKQKWKTELFNKHYVLLPQTYGPYNHKENLIRATKVLYRAEVVFSRDQASIEYLNSIGIRRTIKEHIDLAFMLPYDQSRYTFDNKETWNLGINISGLLWKGGFTSENQFGLTIDYKKYIYSILEHYCSQENCIVHLIPHVIDMEPHPHDDDWQIINNLHKEFPETIVAPAFDNPIDAKSYISNMGFFVGARMHSTIAAISAGVPVLPVSYSRKFEGLYNGLNYHHLIHGKEMITEEAIQFTIDEINRQNDIRIEVAGLHVMIQKKVNSLQDDLDEIINKSVYPMGKG